MESESSLFGCKVFKMMKFKILIISFLISLGLNGQNMKKIDDLRSLCKLKKDTALVSLFNKIGTEYQDNTTDSAKLYFFKARNLSKKIGFEEGELNFIANYVYLLSINGEFKEGLELNKKALQIANKSKDKLKIAKANLNVGTSYQYLEKLDLAINCFLIAEKLLEELDFEQIDVVYSNIGIIYNSIGQYDKALIYQNKAEKVARKSNLTFNLAIALSNKSDCLLSLKKYKEAEKVLNEVLKISQLNHYDYVYSTSLVNMSVLKNATHKYNEIYKYANLALTISQKMDTPECTIGALNSLSIYYLFKKDFFKASQNSNQAFELSKKINSPINQFKTLSLLSDISFANQDVNQALKYQSMSDSIQNIVNLKNVSNKIEEVKGKFESEKKELQIKNLNLKSKNQFWIAIALGLSLLGLGLFAFSQFKNFKTKKALLLLQQDNAIAEERLRIASDMHDDVGSGLSRIRYIVGAVISGQTEQKQGLIKVTEISDDSVQKMKEIIWSLNESNQNLENLIYYIRGQMSEMIENANVDFICHLPETIPAISFGWKRNRNTYLLVKESINNAIKHAEAKTITLDFDISTDLKITVTDDGKGFDTTKNFTGNGLNNYKKRVADLNAKYELKSEMDKGTTFWFLLSL